MNAAEITDKLGLHSLRGRNWYIQATCATSGDGLYEGLDWLSNQLKNVRNWERCHSADMELRTVFIRWERWAWFILEWWTMEISDLDVVHALCLHAVYHELPLILVSFFVWFFSTSPISIFYFHLNPASSQNALTQHCLAQISHYQRAEGVNSLILTAALYITFILRHYK